VDPTHRSRILALSGSCVAYGNSEETHNPRILVAVTTPRNAYLLPNDEQKQVTLADGHFYKVASPTKLNLSFLVSRFTDVLRCLHLVDKTTVPPTEKDRFHKLGTFFPDLLEKFENAVHAGQQLSLDESLLLWKGRLSIKQYNPKKRNRFGIKLFFLVDEETKVILAILPYQGKATKVDDPQWIRQYGFGGAAVLTLTKEFCGKNHKITIDNWFNSPTLASTLLDRKIFTLGTVQKKRKGMPKRGRMAKKLKKGEVEVFSDGKRLIERYAVIIENRLIVSDFQIFTSICL
jgi:hypothetical protein